MENFVAWMLLVYAVLGIVAGCMFWPRRAKKPLASAPAARARIGVPPAPTLEQINATIAEQNARRRAAWKTTPPTADEIAFERAVSWKAFAEAVGKGVPVRPDLAFQAKGRALRSPGPAGAPSPDPFIDPNNILSPLCAWSPIYHPAPTPTPATESSYCAPSAPDPSPSPSSCDSGSPSSWD